MDPVPKRTDSVMIVDDDKFLLDMYMLKFKESGCVVEAVSDPALALKKLRAGSAPSIILFDVVMPALSGFDLLETVKKEGLAQSSVIIMLSNQGQPEDVDRAMGLGASGYIIKSSSIPSEVLQKTLAIVDAKTHST